MPLSLTRLFLQPGPVAEGFAVKNDIDLIFILISAVKYRRDRAAGPLGTPRWMRLMSDLPHVASEVSMGDELISFLPGGADVASPDVLWQ